MKAKNDLFKASHKNNSIYLIKFPLKFHQTEFLKRLNSMTPIQKVAKHADKFALTQIPR